MTFDLLTHPARVRGMRVYGQNICYHVAAFRDFIWFDMQHDHVLKKLNFARLTPFLGSCGMVCRQNICDHVVAFLIPFNLICNMKLFWKNLNWPFDPYVQEVGAVNILATMLLHFMIALNLICNMTRFWKSWILTYWPHPKGRGSGVGGSAGKIFATMLLHSYFFLISY